VFNDILRETWVFQEIMQEGEEKGLKKGLEGLRQTLLDVVQARFPELSFLARGQVAFIEDLEVLRGLDCQNEYRADNGAGATTSAGSRQRHSRPLMEHYIGLRMCPFMCSLEISRVTMSAASSSPSCFLIAPITLTPAAGQGWLTWEFMSEGAE
jgi:hypothetical protein